MIKCLIVEDEALAQHVIKSHLSKFDRFELVAVCHNAPEALDALSKHEIDLIFLDIQLPGMTGLNFLRSLADPPLVVLTTAYAEYALESYEFNVIDYLLKPISLERFSKAANKLLDGRLLTPAMKEQDAGADDHIFIKSGSKFFRINFSEIMYVEGMKDYLKIHTAEHKLVTHQTMNEMEKLLPVKRFMRIHKSYIISVTHIRSINGTTVEMPKISLPIGNFYKERVMGFIGKR